MVRTIRDLTPALGVSTAAALALMTICLDAYDARPVIERWLSASEYPSISISAENHAASFGDLNVAVETSTGQHINLAATRGRVRIATMFYAHCPTMCPLVVETLKDIDGNLTAAERSKLSVLLLSLDPSRDTPAVLRGFGTDRDVDSNRWLLARTASQDVGRVARALGIVHEEAAAGVINHTPVLVLLDAKGKELARSEKLSAPDAQFIAAVRQAIAADARI